MVRKIVLLVLLVLHMYNTSCAKFNSKEGVSPNMEYGYARVTQSELGSSDVRVHIIEELTDAANYYEDVRGKVYEREAYLKLRECLQEGDVLFVDELDSLGRKMQDVVEEWKYLTKVRMVDVVVLNAMVQIDSRAFKKQGRVGVKLESQMLSLLLYTADLQHRRIVDNQREGIDRALKAGVKFGRPTNDMDWDMFHQVAGRWASRELDASAAYHLLNMTRSNFYHYMKLYGYTEKRAANKTQA